MSLNGRERRKRKRAGLPISDVSLLLKRLQEDPKIYKTRTGEPLAMYTNGGRFDHWMTIAEARDLGHSS